MGSNKMISEYFSKLLDHDLACFAHKLGLIETCPDPVDQETAYSLLKEAEKISRMAADDDQRNYCIHICGLIWEYKNPEWDGLGAILIEILSRMGLMPTTTMLDKNFDPKTRTFQGGIDLLSDLKYVARSMYYDAQINGKILELSHFQKRVWDSISENRVIGISAATSAGKSFVLVNKLIDLMKDSHGTAFYIVPTIALINQVTRDMKEALRRYDIKDVQVYQTFSEKVLETESANVFILTQERALAALGQSESILRNLHILIVDEIQNVERVSYEVNDRAYDLYNAIQELVEEKAPEKIIVTGPRIKNIKSLMYELFGKIDVHEITDNLPPVLNITYTFSNVNGNSYIKQYIPTCDSPRTLSYDNRQHNLRFDGIQYRKYLYNSLQFLCRHLRNEPTLIFSPTKSAATDIADKLKNVYKNTNNEKSIDLEEYIRETVHPKYRLIDCVKAGVGYHHGNVPTHARLAIEEAFRQNAITALACTTTLLQGVNLPARYLISRNPYLSRRNKKQKLTPYEFANLRGRAGRLMQDFIGRAIALDEKGFEENQIELFEYNEKEVTSAGYEKRFRDYRDQIYDALEKSSGPEDHETNYNDLPVYIRQMIIKYGVEAKYRLSKAGVKVSDSDIEKWTRMVKQLSVPKQICMKNRHWDPFDLEWIFNNSTKFDDVPSSPFADEFVSNLLSIINMLEQHSYFYYEKYMPVAIQNAQRNKERLTWKMLIIAQGWIEEKRLKDIIQWKHLIDKDEVDNVLALLIGGVEFRLPQLLKPLVDIQNFQDNSENPILAFMELGAHQPAVRQLIGLGLPRETSIRVVQSLQELDVVPDEVIKETDLRRLRDQVPRVLNYYEYQQLDAIVSV
jgi:hypothetical protein